MPDQNHSKIISYIIVAIMGTPYLKSTDRLTRLGFPVWAPNFFSYLTREKGFFEKNNVAVEFTLIPNSCRSSIIIVMKASMAKFAFSCMGGKGRFLTDKSFLFNYFYFKFKFGLPKIKETLIFQNKPYPSC